MVPSHAHTYLDAVAVMLGAKEAALAWRAMQSVAMLADVRGGHMARAGGPAIGGGVW